VPAGTRARGHAAKFATASAGAASTSPFETSSTRSAPTIGAATHRVRTRAHGQSSDVTQRGADRFIVRGELGRGLMMSPPHQEDSDLECAGCAAFRSRARACSAQAGFALCVSAPWTPLLTQWLSAARQGSRTVRRPFWGRAGLGRCRQSRRPAANPRVGGLFLRDFEWGTGDGLVHRRRQLRRTSCRALIVIYPSVSAACDHRTNDRRRLRLRLPRIR